MKDFGDLLKQVGTPIGKPRKWYRIILAHLRFRLIGLAVILISLFITISAVYLKEGDTKADLMAGSTLDNKLVAKLGELIVLPEEKPVVQVIKNEDYAGANIFFKKVKGDDVLFLFPKSDIAILYRPDVNKIVNISPISLIK